MFDEGSQIKVIESFVATGYCNSFENVESCEVALELTIAGCMDLLAVSGDIWIDDFCSQQVGCA